VRQRTRRVMGLVIVGLGGVLLGACGGASNTSGPGYLGGHSTGLGGTAGGGQTTGFAGSGGAGGAAGASGVVDVMQVLRGAGCGKPLPATQPTTVAGTPKGYLQYTVQGTGANLTDTATPAKAGPRTFWVRVPADYDPNRAYRVVYVTHGCGGYNAANTSTYPLFDESKGGTEQAIYVAVDIPTQMANMDCYDTRDGLASQEWEAFQLFHQVVDANYCVDNNRVFVASYGDDGVSLANTWGCYFAGNPQPPRKFAPNYRIRGQVSLSGGQPPDLPACGGPVAALWIHDTTDVGDPISTDYDALDRVLKTNGCAGDNHANSPSAPWDPMPDVCQQYTSCPPAYPVVFCTTVGFGHSWQPERAIPAFTAFFDRVAGTPLPGAGPDGGTDGGDAGDAAGDLAAGGDSAAVD
jgi:polyhydroxybutyrate depolymerase